MAGMDEPVARSRRWVRWLRWSALGLVALVVAVTVFSFGYNAATAGRARVPGGLTYVSAAGVRTRYRNWGTSGSPIVLVHGAVESADVWSRLAPLLATGHRVYAYDVVGWGYSQHTGRYTLDDEVRQLLGFLDALGLERPVLVGHSSGAALVAEATLRRPDRIGAVMLLDGDALSTGAGARSPATRLIVPPYRITVLRLAVRSDRLVRDLYDNACGTACPRLDAAGVDDWRRPLQVPGAEAAQWQRMRLGVPGLAASRLASLATVPVPKAVVFGADDDVFPAGSARQTAARIGAPPPLVIPGARHLSMIGYPDAVAAAIDALAIRAVTHPDR